MSNGRNHNLKVAFIRLIGAVAAQAQADKLAAQGGLAHEIARDLARFEARRFETACHALSTTKE